MRELIKKSMMDSRVEPYVRWLVKRSRGIRMPFDLVKNEIYDRQAFEVIKRVLRADSNCVDIGCHEGMFLQKFLRYAPQGQHFAFEPIPHLAKQLAAGFPTDQVSPCALSNRGGEAVFYVIPDALALSGLNKREFIDSEKTRQAIQIRTERLDDLIPRETKIDLIKIDVEGPKGR
jgi:FkbM family methyltransferase